ncbi:myozenin-1b [Brachyhypopomus gauderio]|uniref:myozenin-1b n=1 Tax=Brachyhypopomus gauderio TaxID=698409 RepID=UPI00404113DF
MSILGPSASPSGKIKPCKIITDLSHITQDEEEESHVAEFDLGTKMKIPKEVMLEELSLLKGKGSKMFQMRQQRVDKFIISAADLNLQNVVPCKPKTPPATMPKPAPVEVDVDAEAEKQKRRDEYVKTYISPWERAMKDDEELKATMRTQMPGPHVHEDLPKYKSFNRTALPFGGSHRGSCLLTSEVSEVKPGPEMAEPLNMFQYDVSSRPSFNRTPIGWVCIEPSHIHFDLDTIPFDGETDDL